MASFNKVILVGNLTRDPQVRHTPGGSAVAEIGLAVNRRKKDDPVDFVDVTLWGKTAEIAGEYLTKGRSVLIEGRLQLDQWDDQETGKKRSRLKVVGENMTMLGKGESKPQTQSDQSYGNGSQSDDEPF